MSYLSSGVRGRQLVLICVRILVQCVVAWSSPQTGMDESSLGCLHAADLASRQPALPDEWDVIAPGLSKDLESSNHSSQRYGG